MTKIAQEGSENQRCCRGVGANGKIDSQESGRSLLVGTERSGFNGDRVNGGELKEFA